MLLGSPSVSVIFVQIAEPTIITMDMLASEFTFLFLVTHFLYFSEVVVSFLPVLYSEGSRSPAKIETAVS